MFYKETDLAVAPPILDVQVPGEWISFLKELMAHIEFTGGEGQLITVAALCRRIAGDFIAGQMLRSLLFWWPKAGRNDGRVYKSAKEWGYELGLSSHEVRVGKSVLAAIVEMKNKKARGAPTTHYRMKEAAFVRQVARVLNIPVSELQGYIANGFAPTTQMDLHPLHKSLTKESTKREQQTDSNNYSNGSRKFFPVGTLLPKQKEPEPIVVRDIPAEVDLLWRMALNQMGLQMDGLAVEACVPELVLVDYETGKFTVVAGTPFAHQLATRHQRVIQGIVRNCGDRTAEVAILTRDEYERQTHGQA